MSILVVRNATIYFIETLGSYVIRMLATQFDHIATRSLQKKLLCWNIVYEWKLWWRM